MKAPEGSIFVAQEPAACQWYFSSLGLLIDLVVTALSPVLPDEVAAAHFGDSMVLLFSGNDPRRGDQPFLYVMPHAGGWGGFEGGDGEDGLINNVNGGFKDYPVEVFEVKYPALVRGYGFRPDTGGPGRFRGGCGLYRTFEVEPGRLPLALVRALEDARLGALRRRRRGRARGRGQPRPRRTSATCSR